MTFKHKLSRRLALLKDWTVIAGAATLAAVVISCERPLPVANSGSALTRLALSPTAVTLRTNAATSFMVVALTASGDTDTAPVALAWSVTGGAITDTSTSGGRHYGHYEAGATPGQYRVVAAAPTASLADTATVTVDPVPVASVSVAPGSASILPAGTVQLTATTKDSAGYTLTGRAVTWTSGNTGVATVSASGLVTGKAAGTATITATSEGQSGTAAITVSSVPVASVSVAPATASVAVGGTVQLTATPKDSSGTALTGRTITWATSNASVATVNGSGLVTGVVTGSATITATSENQSGTSTMTVLASLPVASVTVSPASTDVYVGGAVQLTAIPKDASGNPLSGRLVTWASDNTAVAGVNATGLVSGVAVGSATITATSEGQSGSAAVRVNAQPTSQCGPWPSNIVAWVPPLPLSSGQAFYASPTGDDANPGTLAAPWRSVTKANSLQSGQILYLRAGTYGARGTTALDFSATGTALAPITVSGYPGDARPLIQGRMTMSGSYIRLTNVIVDGPTGDVSGPGPNGEAITIILTGSHLELSNSEVRFDQWHAGVGADAALDYRIINNYIHDNGGYLGDYSTSDAQWNTSHGIYNSPSSYGLVANNVLEHNDAKGLSARHDANHIIFANNTVVGNGRFGVDAAENTYDWVFANNILLNNGTIKGGGGIHTDGTGGLTYVEINNIFWNNGTSGTDTWDNNATVINNIVANPLLVNPAVATDHQNPSPTTDNRLQAGSPAIGFADPNYTLPYDITGKCRGSTPDAGAYQR